MIYGITEEVVVSSPVDIETCTGRLDLCCLTCCHWAAAGMVHYTAKQQHMRRQAESGCGGILPLVSVLSCHIGTQTR